MFHRITIIGFVGQPPSMRYTEDGTPVTNFSVAIRRTARSDAQRPTWLLCIRNPPLAAVSASQTESV